MKKTIITIIIILIIAITGLACVMLLNGVGDQKMSEGTYKIEDCQDFPDAYIKVVGDKIQFYNIDLNSIYQEYQLQTYKRMIELSSSDTKMTEEEVAVYSDLNETFVSNPFKVVYSESDDNKVGTFTYVHFLMNDSRFFGLTVHYDSLNKTITVKNSKCTLTFKK